MKYLVLTVLLLSSLHSTAQTYNSVEEQPETPVWILQLALPTQTFSYDVKNYKFNYNTTDVFGNPTTASGLVSVPVAPQGSSYPMAVYSHGTVSNREAVPSRELVGERYLVQGLAANGYITVAPDYLGLGDNDAPVHPYVHADSEASAGRDLLLAAREWLDGQGTIQYNDQLFLTGYSQGGHATQALHRDIQSNPGEENLVVTAATHLSGPYSISDIMRGVLFSDDLDTRPGYIAYTYISYNYVYGIYDDFNDAFTPAYVGVLDSFSEGIIDLGEFNRILDARLERRGEGLGDLLAPEAYTQLVTKDTSAAIVRALLDNDTYDWAPEAPTIIYYCTADEQVPFRNAFIADSVMAANGSTSVLLETGGPLDHGDCVTPAVSRTIEFFGQYFQSFPVSTHSIVDLPGFTITPNPARAGQSLKLHGLPEGDFSYELISLHGQVIDQRQNQRVGNNIPLRIATTTPPGIYGVRIIFNDQSSVVRRIIVQ